MTNARLVVPFLCVLVAGCASQAPEQSAQNTDQPYANLAQLMRAIPFPNSNLIFDTQAVDPQAALEPAATGGDATATQLFSSVYGGWQAVENASLAIAETANLLLIPGRTCENGQPVPIQNEDFQQWTRELAQAGLEAYKVAQMQSARAREGRPYSESDMDEMILISGTLTEACDNCHQKYRETPNQPADRCM